MRRSVILLLLVSVLVSGSTISAVADGRVERATPRRARMIVRMVDSVFMPRVVEVSKGTRVRWVNRGDLDHTSTATGLWDSGLVSPGESFSRTFRRAGTFPYVCAIHPRMTGRVVVR